MKQNKYYLKNFLILLMSVSLILFTQWVKLIKNPESTPITKETVLGLLLLLAFALIGIAIKELLSNVSVKFIRDFPVLGWVSITSLIMCLLFSKVIEYIKHVDFLSITTPILTFAGISVVNRLVELRKISWKIVVVGIFVFLGTYLGSATVSQIALKISGAL